MNPRVIQSSSPFETLQLLLDAVDYCQSLDTKFTELLETCTTSRTEYLRTQTATTTISATGAAFTALGLALAVPTLGASLPLAVSGGITSMSGSLGSIIISFVYDTRVTRIIKECDGLTSLLDHKLQDLRQKLDVEGGLQSQELQLMRRPPAMLAKAFLLRREFTREAITSRNMLRAGDHIYRRGNHGAKMVDIFERLRMRKVVGSRSTFYDHHGIYLSNGKHGEGEVCHFGTSWKTPVISTLDEFMSGSIPAPHWQSTPQLFRRNYGGNEIEPSETVTLARLWVAEERVYDVLHENCEHFATELKLCVSWSDQASRVRVRPKAVAAVRKHLGDVKFFQKRLEEHVQSLLEY